MECNDRPKTSGGPPPVGVQRGGRVGDQRGAVAAGEARRAGAVAAGGAAGRAAVGRLLPAAGAGPARLRAHRAGRPGPVRW